MRQQRTIEYLGFTIRCLLLSKEEDAPTIYGEVFREDAVGGVARSDGNEFTVWFRDIPPMNAMVHETYHLFCYLMETMNGETLFAWSELNTEIYAYGFHTLFNRVSDTFTGMQLYKRMYDEYKEGTQ